MKKRYDYHSVEDFKALFFGFSIVAATISVFFAIREISLSGKLFFFVLAILSIIVPVFTYLNKKHTFIEVNENGILFNGRKKRVFAQWTGVREIKMLTPLKASFRYKIYTDKGNFTIGMVEPANEPSLSSFDLMKANRAKYLNELIAEIKKRASHAKFTYSLFNRPL